MTSADTMSARRDAGGMADAIEALDWTRDGAGWPHREASRFVAAGGITWHVQVMGTGPVLLMLHGTGASTQSWRGLAPLLAPHFTLVMPDLPGHGFTQRPADGRLSLPAMADLVAQLTTTLDMAPTLAVGHSAGAAILARMTLDQRIAPRRLVSLAGALLPFPGLSGQIFPALARLLFVNPFAVRLATWRAGDRAAVARLLEGTGSKIDDAGLDLYARLFTSRGHVAATLAMMAAWDLEPLVRDLPRLGVPLVLVAPGGDRAVAPDVAFRIRDLVPGARVAYLRNLGHLAHEERPDLVAELILAEA